MRLGLVSKSGWILTFICFFFVPATASALLNVAVEAGPDPAEPGEALRVAITVTNPGTTTSGPVTIQLPYPTGLASVSESFISDSGGCTGTSCEVPEVVTWSLPALGAGEGTTVTLAPAVSSSAVVGSTILFDVDALESGGLAASAQHQISVIGDRFFELSVDESREPANSGATLVYEVTYGNRSAESTTGTELTFTPPPGTSFLGASGGGTFSGGMVTWDLATLIGHEGGRRTVSLRVGAGQGGGVILRGAKARITGQGDFASHQSEAEIITRIENGSRLIVNMVINPDPAFQNESTRASIMVTNPTGSFANDVRLKLRYPKGLFSQSEEFISDGGGCIGTSCDNGEELFWNLGDLPPGRGVTVSLAPAIGNVPGGTLVTYPVVVQANGQSRTLARQTLIVRDARIFDLAVDPERSPVTAGERQVFTLVFGNRSTETTTGTTLRLPIPGGLSFISASDGGVSQGGAVVWNLGTLAGREGGQRQVILEVASIAEGAHLFVDPATISGQGDFLFHETRSRSLSRVENDTRLDVAITADKDPAAPGERLSLRATVTNRSQFDFANDVVLRWRHPGTLASVGDDLVLDGFCTGTSCDAAEIATFNLGTLPPGGGVVVEWPPEVIGSLDGGRVFTNPVEVDATDRSRTRASHSVLVRDSRVLDLAVDSSFDPLDGTAIYELTYGNRSNENITGVELIFPLPAGVTVTGASNGGRLESGGDLLAESVVWNLGTLQARHNARRRVEVSVAASPEGEISRVFDAKIQGQGPFFQETTRGRDARRIEQVTRTIQISGAPIPVLPGNMLSTTIDIVNLAPSFLFDLDLRLRYPEGLASVSDSAVSDGGGCTGTSCDEAELVFWSLGDLAPGAMIDVTLPPNVAASTPQGSLIRFWARLSAGSFGQAVGSKAIPVGNNFTEAGPIQRLGLFLDDFESGNTAKWTLTQP